MSVKIRREFGVYIVISLAIILVSVSCSSTTAVSRVASTEAIDLTGNWNDVDVNIVCTTLINECLSSPRLASYEANNGRLPLIVVGSFKNQSDEHINTSIISSKMSNAIINSGRADFITEDRSDIRSERMDQLDWAGEDKAKAIANEDAADFMLQGTVKTIVQKNGNTSVRTYFVTAELTDVETGRIIWTGENSEIKKVVKEASVRW